MTEAAKVTGSAGPVEAVAGPPLPDHMALALALREAVDADARVERAERGLAKASDRARTAVEQAKAALKDARTDAAAASGQVADLAAGDGGAAAVGALKAAAIEAQRVYERAAELLGGGE